MLCRIGNNLRGDDMKNTVYDQLGVRPIINARGTYSSLGGSILSPPVWAAMSEANRQFVSMADLLKASGTAIANMLGAEAARVTLGASGGITLGVAACIAKGDGAVLERLPDASGVPNEIVIQRRHRYRYDSVVRLPGARLVEVGSQNGTTVEDLSAAMGPKAAAIIFPAHLDGIEGTISMDRVIPLAHERDVPIIVDAAYLVYPIDRMKHLAQSAADLVCFSAKYMGGPNSGGFICGRRVWIDAVARTDFVAFETGKHRVLGRPFKLDRHTVVGVVAALEEWLETNHKVRLEACERRARRVLEYLTDVSAAALTLMCFTMDETLEPEPINCLHIKLDPRVARPASEVEAALRAGDPSIVLHLRGDSLIVDTEMVSDDEVEALGTRLRSELTRVDS
jgi:D-glucosaminate-6-phosphate ammonia-lyase